MPGSLSVSLKSLFPVPLRDRLAARDSSVWGKDLNWNPGERIFLQAPSGTGKTTLIHILYGIRDDYDGKVLWGNRDLLETGKEALSAMRRESISVIFQDLRLFPALTTRENLEIKRHLTDAVSAEEMEAWMERLGIADRAGKPAATLSYGEQQRTAIIRALLQPFEWLLMDEPFSHLDIANTHIAAGLISEVAERRGASFVLADLDDNSLFPYTQKLLL